MIATSGPERGHVAAHVECGHAAAHVERGHAAAYVECGHAAEYVAAHVERGHATHGIRVRRMDGPAEDMSAVWERLCGWGCGRLLLWDVVPEQRRASFLHLPERAEFFEATRRGEPVAYAWLSPLAAGSPVAQAHFGGATHADTLTAGRLLLEALRREGRLLSLIGVIPWPYRHARRLVRELGFAELRVPGLCRLEGRGAGRGAGAARLVPGALVVKALA